MSTFSVTERGSFKRCRRAWYWGSFNGAAIQPAFPATALNVGTIWHRGSELWSLDAMGNTTEPGRPRAHFTHHMMQAFVDVDAEIRAMLDRDLWPEEEYKLGEQRDLLMAMATNYEGKWGSPLPDHFEMVQPEQTVVVDVPGSPHKLEATLDGLIRNKENGLAFVLERKTYSARPREDALQFGDQFLAYLWVLQQLGFETGGVAYDGAWKRAEPGRGKTIDDMFLRFTISRNQREIDRFGYHLPAELEEMEQAKMEERLRYPNHRWEGCWDCSFVGLCQATERGEPLILDDFISRPVRDRAEVWPS